MRKELTRTKQTLDKETVRKIIEITAYGVLSLNGDDGYLYTCLLYTSLQPLPAHGWLVLLRLLERRPRPVRIRKDFF